MSSVSVTSDEANVPTLVEETSMESTIEQQFEMLVGNLDLDLIVKTYETLQCSENVDGLIEDWLANSSEHELEPRVNELTLEENLKRFIQFSQKR